MRNEAAWPQQSERNEAAWPQQSERSEATRLLCKRAYHDEWFANTVVENLLTDDLAVITPSVGIDLRPILLHCLASSKRRHNRDMGLVATLLLSILLAFFSPGFLVISLVIAFALTLADQRWQHREMFLRLRRVNFERQPYPPELPEPWIASRLTDIAEAQQGNVTVYSDYRPFIGYGSSVSSWSFALPMLPATGLDGQTATSVIPFTAAELTEHVHLVLSELADESKSVLIGERLEGLYLEERVFVDGKGLDIDGPFLLNRSKPPVNALSIDKLNTIATDSRGKARYYLCAHIPSWDGQVVASTFLRFSTDGYLLYAECERTVLPPVRDPYLPGVYVTDRAKSLESFPLIGNALIDVVPKLLTSPWRVVRSLDSSNRFARRSAHAREWAAEDLDFNYGTSLSVRELFADARYHNYYQWIDATKHLKIVERHLLEAIAVFLEEHRVDTAELRNRQTTILNQGIIQTGGVNNIGAQAVGHGAAASQNSPISTTGTPV